MGSFFFACLHLLFLSSLVAIEEKSPQKVLICGVCRNVQSTFSNTVANIEKLGERFQDYAVLIYENNSNDKTAALFLDWAKKNPKIFFHNENMHQLDLPRTRIGKISRARNKVLDMARDPSFSDFEYLIMADLDFATPWPIDEIVNSVNLPFEWDCISANGVRNLELLFKIPSTYYFDRLAFRNLLYPFGPELLGDSFWVDLNSETNWFSLNEGDLIPVFSAFGGLAIYKTKTITKFAYCGIPNDDLKMFYRNVFENLDETNYQFRQYLSKNGVRLGGALDDVPIIFRADPHEGGPACCEHVCLHASMILNGHGKMYINPKMYMYYSK